jgi:hypothetical protein
MQAPYEQQYQQQQIGPPYEAHARAMHEQREREQYARAMHEIYTRLMHEAQSREVQNIRVRHEIPNYNRRGFGAIEIPPAVKFRLIDTFQTQQYMGYLGLFLHKSKQISIYSKEIRNFVRERPGSDPIRGRHQEMSEGVSNQVQGAANQFLAGLIPAEHFLSELDSARVRLFQFGRNELEIPYPIW